MKTSVDVRNQLCFGVHFILFACTQGSKAVTPEALLFEHLMLNHNPAVRPVLNPQHPVTVNLSLNVDFILDLQEREQVGTQKDCCQTRFFPQALFVCIISNKQFFSTNMMSQNQIAYESLQDEISVEEVACFCHCDNKLSIPDSGYAVVAQRDVER